MTLKVILIDMDGTITKFNLDYMWMRRAALQMLKEAGLWRPSFSDQMSIYAMLNGLRGSISNERLDEIKKRIYEKVQTIESEAAELTIPRHLLQEMHLAGLWSPLPQRPTRVGSRIRGRHIDIMSASPPSMIPLAI